MFETGMFGLSVSRIAMAAISLFNTVGLKVPRLFGLLLLGYAFAQFLLNIKATKNTRYYPKSKCIDKRIHSFLSIKKASKVSTIMTFKGFSRWSG